MIKNLHSKAIGFLDTTYTLKFIFRLLLLYFLFRLANWMMVGAVAPGGFYSSFLDKYLNYVTLIKVSVLQTGSWLAQLVGVDSFLLDSSRLRIVGSGQLTMAWACCGLEIMSLWAAFTLSDTTPLKKKLTWCFAGLACVWFINCIRVALIIIAIKKGWPEVGTLSHHDTFTIIAYFFVLVLIFFYYRKNKKQFTD